MPRSLFISSFRVELLVHTATSTPIIQTRKLKRLPTDSALARSITPVNKQKIEHKKPHHFADLRFLHKHWLGFF
ncbi:hypothetical protein BD289DRAFT_448990, partial [Coniella lustricola]